MIINGKWMSEPEIIALISQLTAEKEKLERQAAKRGKWIEVSPKHSRCSVCDTTCLIAVYPISKGANYCPNCGADMRGTEI
jgi:hypothetical protein